MNICKLGLAIPQENVVVFCLLGLPLKLLHPDLGPSVHGKNQLCSMIRRRVIILFDRAEVGVDGVQSNGAYLSASEDAVGYSVRVPGVVACDTCSATLDKRGHSTL